MSMTPGPVAWPLRAALRTDRVYSSMCRRGGRLPQLQLSERWVPDRRPESPSALLALSTCTKHWPAARLEPPISELLASRSPMTALPTAFHIDQPMAPETASEPDQSATARQRRMSVARSSQDSSILEQR